MTQCRTHALLLLSLILASTTIFEIQAQNRVDERSDFRNTSYVKTDDDELKTLFALADEALADENFPVVVNNLVRALKRGGDALVAFGDRTYLTGRNAARHRLADLPPKGFRLYTEAVADEAMRLLAAGFRHRDDVALRELAARLPLTAAAFQALKRVGDLARERGDFLAAITSYNRYLEDAALLDAGSTDEHGSASEAVEPSPEERDQIRAALYLCLLQSGHVEEALEMRITGSIYHRGVVVAASPVVDALGRAAFEHGDEGAEGGWPTRGGARSRARLPCFDAGTLNLLWRYTLTADDDEVLPSPLSINSLHRRSSSATRLAAQVYPVVDGGRIYAFDQHRLHALDLETGAVAFGPLTWDWSLLFGDEEAELENVTYAGTVAGGRLFVTLNYRNRHGSFLADHTGTLLALDLSCEGTCLWLRGAARSTTPKARFSPAREKEDPILAAAAFSGAPVVVAQRVYLLGTHHQDEQAESWLFCFDARNGDLLFKSFLCSGVEVQRFGTRIGSGSNVARDKVELGAPLVERGGTLYCLSNLGVSAAVDACSGEILWLMKYNRIYAQDPDVYTRAYFRDTGGWCDSLPLLQGGRFVFAPADSRFLYSLAYSPDPAGYIILDDPIERGRFVAFIGTDGELFYFTAREGGRNYVAAAERSGALVWESELFEPEDRIAGQPLLTQAAIFVPTLRYLYRIDLGAEGLMTHAFPAPARGAKHESLTYPHFGNIITTRKRLISVSNTQILVFAP